MGTPEAAVPSLRRLVADGHEVLGVWTQADRPAGRGRRLTASPVKNAAKELGIDVYQPLSLRKRAAREEFRRLNADACILVAYGKILPGSFLSAFGLGCINVHFSLLPKYRGAAPVVWAIARGETETGVTTMQMDEGLDTGDILLQEAVAIGDSEDAAALMSRLSVLGAELLSDTLERLGTIVPKKQDESLASLAPLLTKTDGLIDWNRPAAEIARRIRAFQPFPKSYSRYKEQTITFWRAEACGEAEVSAVPGEVLRASGRELWIAAGSDTRLCVWELQAEGRKRLPTREFLNGIGIAEGEKLGA